MQDSMVVSLMLPVVWLTTMRSGYTRRTDGF
jgi:hypothetical protein